MVENILISHIVTRLRNVMHIFVQLISTRLLPTPAGPHTAPAREGRAWRSPRQPGGRRGGAWLGDIKLVSTDFS